MRAVWLGVALVAACGSGTERPPDAGGPSDAPLADASDLDGPGVDAWERPDAVEPDAVGSDAVVSDAVVPDAVVPDAPVDAQLDAPVDAQRDAPIDGAPDAPIDAPDAVPDAPSPDAAPQPNIAFVTSTRYSGQLGGLAGADAKCMARAAAAGLSGTFVAWLSTSTVNAKDRLSSARAWVRTDGNPFTDRVDDLVAGRILYPLRYDEFGADTGTNPYSLDKDVWAGTSPDGVVDADDGPTVSTCSDWMELGDYESHGVTYATTGWWTNGGGSGPGPDACAPLKRLYCFQIDHSTPLTIPPTSGRLAFLSASSFIPGGGIASADALCTNEAAAAGRPGTFKALLATSTASALSRFSLAGGWYRVDRVPWSGFSETGLNVTLDGTYEPSDLIDPWDRVWTGSHAPNVPGTAATTCENWTSTVYDPGGIIGVAEATGVATGFDGPLMPCNDVTTSLYCLQE